MKHIENVKDKIREGIIEAYKDTVDFTDNPAQPFHAEYLLTVNVAKKINDLNGYYADTYTIVLEKNVADLAINSLPKIKWGDGRIGGSSIFRDDDSISVSRNGKVDIALYSSNHKRVEAISPLCVIELKSFNPQRKRVISDIQRNIELISLKGETGTSSIEFSFFASIEKYQNTSNFDKKSSYEKEVRKKYEKWMSSITINTYIEVIIDVFTISKELHGREYIDSNEYYLDTSTKHHFVGVIITLKKA